jgi:glycosyltransferase involved in cell wall biosynthesis
MRKKKIAFFLQNLSGGGAEKSVVNLSNYLVDDGIDIDIVLVDKANAAYLDELNPNINIIDLKKNRSLKSIFEVKRYIETNNPEVIMSSVTHINLVLLIVKVFTKTANTKFVINQVNHLTSIVKYALKINNLSQFFTRSGVKFIVRIYNYADGCISMSKGVEMDLKNHGLNIKSQYIYNPIFSEEIVNLSKTQLSKSDKKVFIAIGRMVPQKNFSLLLDAFYLVNKEINSELIILGDGPLLNVLTKKINDLNLNESVILKGFVSNPFKYIKVADVFVLSSLWEGFGNVIVEALSLGTQVVSTNCNSGPAEILENGKYGFISSTMHKFELARLMIEAINNPIDRDLIIERGRYFSIRNSSIEYKDFLLNY